jgi:SPP1 family predicted phage head-tail adaptor
VKVVDIRKLNRRIKFTEQVQTSVNEYNEKKFTWQEAFVRWGMMTARPGSGRVEADQLTQETNYFFYTRYQTDINERMRIEYEGNIYRIISITEPPNFRKQLWEIKTELLPEEDA